MRTRFPFKTCFLIGFLIPFAFGIVFAQPKGKGGRSAPVVVVPVSVEKVSPTSILTAPLHPVQKEILSIEEAGRVVKINKEKGDLVGKGEVLAVIANPNLRAAFVNAKANKSEAEIKTEQLKRKWLRTRSLHQKKITTPQQLDDDLANYSLQTLILEKTTNELDRLKKILDGFKIKAPFDGQIIQSNLERGQWVTPSMNLYLLVGYNAFEMKMGVPGRYSGKIPLHQEVAIRIKETGHHLVGTIEAVTHHVEDTTGNFSVTLKIPNPDDLPVSGLLAEAALPIGEPTEQMLVPRDALVVKTNSKHIVIAQDERAKIVPVEILGSHKDKVIIRSMGIKKGDLVVVRGNERLFPGMELKISSPDLNPN